MSRLVKLVAFALVFAMLISVCTVFSGSVVAAEVSEAERNAGKGARSIESSFDTSVNVKELSAYLDKELMSCPVTVDVSSFEIPYTDENVAALDNLIWYESPLLFHVEGVGFSVRGKFFASLTFTYKYSSTEYQIMRLELVSAANEMLKGIAGNDSLDDVTKALLLHDRLIVACEYDYVRLCEGRAPKESYDAYGALVDGYAVCQGYSKAYMYLLTSAGIDSYLCESRELNHVWNIVTINGKKYHVDTTYDDPIYDVTGKVQHKNFLLSTKALKNTGHFSTDYDSSPVDTTYDDYFWKSTDAEFQLVNNKVYYIDYDTDTLREVGNSKDLCKVSDKWPSEGGGYWRGDFGRLTSCGTSLFYTLSDGIYAFDLKDMKSKTVYKVDRSKNKALSIYGCAYDNASQCFVCEILDSPNYDANTKTARQVKVPYSVDMTVPTAKIASTSNVSAYQTVTLEMHDNVSLMGYYWGTDPVYTNNRFVSLSNASANSAPVEYVSKPGTYYLTVLDGSYNASSSYSIKFNFVSLDAKGGKVGLTSVVIPQGSSVNLPVPVREGYKFLGWSNDNNEAQKDLFTFINPAVDCTCYAVWEKIDDYVAEELPVYTDKFCDVAKNSWYADAVAYCAQRKYINGVSDSAFSPNTNLKREQFVLILANLSGISADNYKFVNSGLKDVAMGKWYSGAVAWAVSEGYVKGVSADRFGLGQNITREQLARLFYVYAEDIGLDVSGRADLSVFSDAGKVSSWALENVQWAVAVGLISGTSGTTLSPQGVATRAQAARIIMIFDGLNKVF